jgi:hypothetical protein
MEMFSDRTWQRQAIRFQSSNLNMRRFHVASGISKDWRIIRADHFSPDLQQVTRTERAKSRRNREAMAHSKGACSKSRHVEGV